ncbi:MAG: GMC family oxidoreductase [Rhodobacteraceae bacterium]|nr:GMC family oxidoreductase [Paracoccaceae bacterium]
MSAEKADFVIGSGPAGISVARALLDAGRKVVLVDDGKRAEPEALARRDTMAASDPATWTRAARAAYMAPQFAAPPGQVRRYGSDFAMELADATFASAPPDFALRASRAAGGLSNLWGAAVLPYAQSDMAGWPIGEADLAPHYRAVATFVPIAGRTDDLAGLFPALSIDDCTSIEPSPQARTFLARLGAAKPGLNRLGIRAGAARQAVAAGCRQCGLCLHGCPWSLIYSAQSSLDDLRGHPRLTYRPGSVVTHVSEDDGGVRLGLSNGQAETGGRVFLAAGVLETARLLLASELVAGERLTLRDSQHAFLPALQWRFNRVAPDRPPYHTLPQAFLELGDAAISPFLVHAQIYTWNEHFAADLVANYGRLPGSAPLLRQLARRLVVAQIFLHSAHSARLHLRLAADGRLDASIEPSPDTGAVLAGAAERIGAALALGGLRALTFARRDGAPGSSFHVGASLPMTSTPKAGQSDPLGRPAGLRRIHVVDASVLPAVPATTITFSVMANAHRIGTAACA